MACEPLFVVVFGVLFGRQLGPLFCLLFCSGGDSGVHVVFEVLLSNGVFCSGDGNSNKTWAFGEHCSGYTLRGRDREKTGRDRGMDCGGMD